jgi:UDP-GlcNAc3NAcA epimerase
MKLAPVYFAIGDDKTFDQTIIHTGQHYDAKLSDDFLREFGLPEPDEDLEVGSLPHLPQIGNMLVKLDAILSDIDPDMIYVYGDTNSTVAGAIAASKRNIPLAHIEAGLREFDNSIPEEVNKLLTDSVSDLLFCPTQTAVDNLNNSNHTGEVHLVGDVVVDLLKYRGRTLQSPLEKYGVFKGEYYFATCHRAANTDEEKHLDDILSALSMLDLPVVFPVHYRTRQAIDQHELHFIVELNDNIIDIDPIGFWDTQQLIKHAKCVITDSGGIIREANVHQTPCVIIDKQTEWIESVEAGWAVVTGPGMHEIVNAVNSFQIPDTHSEIFGDGKASERILNLTKQYFAKHIEK